MKKYILFILFFTVFCGLSAQKIPSSNRSKQVILKNRNNINKSFNKKKLKLGNNIFIRIFKQSKELEIWVKEKTKFELYKTYKIVTYGGEGIEPKIKQGDSKAPEGFYYFTPRQMNPWSSYHLSFNIGYPNKYDKIHGRTGSAIMVHGSTVSIGCFAMTDKKIEEIYTIVNSAFENGQKFIRIHIFPFRMNQENLEKFSKNRWFEFWKNLQEGYEIFEKDRIPPDVNVKNKKYIFNTM